MAHCLGVPVLANSAAATRLLACLRRGVWDSERGCVSSKRVTVLCSRENELVDEQSCFHDHSIQLNLVNVGVTWAAFTRRYSITIHNILAYSIYLLSRD